MKTSSEEPLVTWWKSFKKNFILPDGRVQRPEHDYDTVSEGQAYAMLFSVFMKDKETFTLLYDWTEKHLSRSDAYGDHLLAWHWKDGDVRDWMPASDADCDFAFALLLASLQWEEKVYREKAVQVIHDILKLETARGVDNRLFLLPGLWGNEKKGHLVQNPSYYSPAAFRMFYEITQDDQWLDLVKTTYWILNQSGVHMDNVSGCGLIPDWCIVDSRGNISTAEGRSNDYGWEAVRVPMRVGLDILWYKTADANTVVEKIYQVLQRSGADTGEIRAVYRYTGVPAVEYSSLPADAMACFMAQILNSAADKIRASLKNKLSEKSFILNYYGQSLAFFPLAHEAGILKRLRQSQ
ncbi:MAG: endoglucanase [Candidatus Brocadia sp.]|nr:endoglucanase [Candidatus Brocadia sp.]